MRRGRACLGTIVVAAEDAWAAAGPARTRLWRWEAAGCAGLAALRLTHLQTWLRSPGQRDRYRTPEVLCAHRPTRSPFSESHAGAPFPPAQWAPGLGPTGRSNVGCLSGGTGQARRLRSEVQAFRSGLCRKSREQGSRGKARGRSRMAVGAVTGSGRVRRRSEVPAASACASAAAQRVWGAACGRRRARETRVGVSPMAPMALSRGDSLPHGSGAIRVPHTEGCFVRRLAERGLCRSHLTPHPRGPPRLLRFVPKSQSGKSGFQSVRSTFESWKRRCRSAPTFDEPAPLPLWPPRPPGPRSAPRR